MTQTYTKEQLQAVAEKRRREKLQKSITAKMVKAYGSVEAFWSEVAIVGNPQDQIENFLRYGYVPQPKQLRFHKVARECDVADYANEVGFGGARGGGKSHALFAQIVLDDTQRLKGLKSLFLRQAKGKAKEQFDDLVKEVLEFVPKSKYDWSSFSGVLKIFGGRIIIGHFKNATDIGNYLGIAYDAIAIEECTQLIWKFYKAAQDSNRTSKEGWRPRMYNSTNPGGVGHNWYKKRFILPLRRAADAAIRGLTNFVQSLVDDNKFVDSDYKRKLAENVGWKLRAHLHGDWDIAAGQFFENWRDDIHNVPAFNPPADWEYWVSKDIGHAHWDITYLHCKSGDGVTYTIDEVAMRKAYPEDIAPEMLKMLERWELTIDDLSDQIAGSDAFVVDAKSKNNTTVAEQYQEYGFDFTRAATERGSRVEGARLLSKLLGDPSRGKLPQWFVFGANCPKLVECIPSLVHNPKNPDDVLKVNASGDTGDGGDDPYDAWRYGIRRPERKSIRIVSSGKRRNIHQVR